MDAGLAAENTNVVPLPVKIGNKIGAAWSGSEFGSEEVLSFLPAAVYTTDAAGRITFYNEAAAALWGCRPELGKSEWCGSWRLYWPDGKPMPHDECPMAMALKEKRAIRGAEAIAERPDGTRVPFLAYPTPLCNESGALVGGINTLVDITERKCAEYSRQRLAAIVESSDDSIVSKDLNGIIRTWNPAAERLFGYSAKEVLGKPVTMLIPRDRQEEEAQILARIRRGERVEHYDTVRIRKDGSLVEVSLAVSPIKTSEGRITGASKVARDISARRRAEEQHRLLLSEMNHRIKNLFSLIGSLVNLSARSAATPNDLADGLRGRLVALAHAHELTLPSSAPGREQLNRTATLHDLVQAIVAPYLSEGHSKIHIIGPDVLVGRNTATSMGLLLHEMATNAAKFGALSCPGGQVDVSWSISKEELSLTWKERSGPPVSKVPEKEGFGSVLTRLTVNGQLGGRVSRDWNKEGLTVNLSAPMAGLVN